MRKSSKQELAWRAEEQEKKQMRAVAFAKLQEHETITPAEWRMLYDFLRSQVAWESDGDELVFCKNKHPEQE